MSKRVQGEATVPSTLGDELKLNPFLRPGDAAIRKALGACLLLRQSHLLLGRSTFVMASRS